MQGPAPTVVPMVILLLLIGVSWSAAHNCSTRAAVELCGRDSLRGDLATCCAFTCEAWIQANTCPAGTEFNTTAAYFENPASDVCCSSVPPARCSSNYACSTGTFLSFDAVGTACSADPCPNDECCASAVCSTLADDDGSEYCTSVGLIPRPSARLSPCGHSPCNETDSTTCCMSPSAVCANHACDTAGEETDPSRDARECAGDVCTDAECLCSSRRCTHSSMVDMCSDAGLAVRLAGSSYKCAGVRCTSKQCEKETCVVAECCADSCPGIVGDDTFVSSCEYGIENGQDCELACPSSLVGTSTVAQCRNSALQPYTLPVCTVPVPVVTEENDAEEEVSSSGGDFVGEIAGIGSGAFVGAVCLFACVLFVVHKRRPVRKKTKKRKLKTHPGGFRVGSNAVRGHFNMEPEFVHACRPGDFIVFGDDVDGERIPVVGCNIVKKNVGDDVAFVQLHRDHHATVGDHFFVLTRDEFGQFYSYYSDMDAYGPYNVYSGNDSMWNYSSGDSEEE